MPLFLHTADWQMGRQYGRFAAEDAAALSEARFKTVERLGFNPDFTDTSKRFDTNQREVVGASIARQHMTAPKAVWSSYAF